METEWKKKIQHFSECWTQSTDMERIHCSKNLFSAADARAPLRNVLHGLIGLSEVGIIVLVKKDR